MENANHSHGRRVYATVVSLCLVAITAACGAQPTPQTFIVQIFQDTPLPATQSAEQALSVSPVPTYDYAGVAPTLSSKSAATCSLIRLVPGLHISASGSYTMTEDESAGPMMCQIQRESCAYGLLVTNRDPEISFADHKLPPFNLEDRQFHPAMLLPLTHLRNMVQTEWDGNVRLLVTSAYDSTGEHDLAQPDMLRKYSLHFEGRSVDLVTNPPDPEKLDRLCALAYCAGFDWVQNESDHCHASIKADSLCSFCSGSVPTAIPSPTTAATFTPVPTRNK
ncbi:MAG TPA: hypothetical protein VGK87_09335 [Anaerolineae bacterium]|jgi:hypothetical protein